MNIQEYKSQAKEIHDMIQLKSHKGCSCVVSSPDNSNVSRTSKLTVYNPTSNTTKRIKANEYLLGCPICNHTHTHITSMSPVYIKIANIIHHNKYEYVPTDNSFVCPSHGTQTIHTLYDHLVPQIESGYTFGCRTCHEDFKSNKYKSQTSETNLYVLSFKHKNKDEQFYKLGITMKTIKERFLDWSKYHITELLVIPCDSSKALEVERQVGCMIKERKLSYTPEDAKVSGSTTNLGGCSECFNTKHVDSLVSKVKSLLNEVTV